MSRTSFWRHCRGHSADTGAVLLHVRITVFELSRQVGRRRHPSVSQQPARGIKPGEVTNSGQDHGIHAAAIARNGGNGRMQFIHDGLDRGLNFFNFGIQLPNEPNGMLQFQGLGRYPEANGASGGTADIYSHIPPTVVSGGIRQQDLQPVRCAAAICSVPGNSGNSA